MDYINKFPVFKLGRDILKTLEYLSTKQSGLLFNKILKYVNDVPFTDSDNSDSIVNIVFIQIKTDIDRVNINNKNTFLYFIVLKDGSDEFIKIGVTYNLIRRYSYFEKIGFKVEQIKVIEFKNRNLALKNEKLQFSKFFKYKLNTNRSFDGKNECFSICIKKLI